MSSRPAALALGSARAEQLFRDGFMQQPLSVAIATEIEIVGRASLRKRVRMLGAGAFRAYHWHCWLNSRGAGEKTGLEESPDTAGRGGREIDPGNPAGKCHRNPPPKRRATPFAKQPARPGALAQALARRRQG